MKVKRVSGMQFLGAVNMAIYESFQRGDDPITISREEVIKCLGYKCKRERQKGWTLSISDDGILLKKD